ncbi:MAG TPA: hypothetical protein VGJ84_04875 [Polyangiaceae bacterium]|jgi:hypothetical protein
MFTNKGSPMKPSAKLTAEHVTQFIAASEAIVARAITTRRA